jgi:hypothetical protein
MTQKQRAHAQLNCHLVSCRECPQWNCAKKCTWGRTERTAMRLCVFFSGRPQLGFAHNPALFEICRPMFDKDVLEPEPYLPYPIGDVP